MQSYKENEYEKFQQIHSIVQSYKKNEYEKFQPIQHPKPHNIIITQNPQTTSR